MATPEIFKIPDVDKEKAIACMKEAGLLNHAEKILLVETKRPLKEMKDTNNPATNAVTLATDDSGKQMLHVLQSAKTMTGGYEVYTLQAPLTPEQYETAADCAGKPRNGISR